MNIALGSLALTVGFVFVAIPGPAIPFLLLGGGLLASESRGIARVMDWSELRLRALWRWARRQWQKLSLGAEIAVIGVALCGAVAGVYTFWRIID